MIFVVEVILVQKKADYGWRGKYGDNVLYMINTNVVDGVSLNESDLTFDNDTLHTIKFFYLEIGAVVYNCKIRFNIPGNFLIQKNILDESCYDDDYEFKLYDVTNVKDIKITNTKYLIGDNEYYTDLNDRFTLIKDVVVALKLTNYYRYYVIETNLVEYSALYKCTFDGEVCSGVNKISEFIVNPSSSYKARFTNKIKTFSLKVSMTLYDGNDSELFHFKINLRNKDGKVGSVPNNIELLNKYVIDDNDGSIVYGLRNGDYIIIKDIPIDMVVNLQEVLHDGYMTIIKSGDVILKRGDSYEFIMDDNKDITIHNIASVMLPATGSAGILSYLVVGIIFMFISLWFGVKYLYKKTLGGILKKSKELRG